MSGTERPSGSESADPGGEPVVGFLAELARAFGRHRPQGSAGWNFSDAFTRLERLVGAGREQGGDAQSGPAQGPDGKGGSRQGVARRLLDRSLGSRPEGGERAASGSAGAEGSGSTQAAVAGFDATLEAFRFLAARVEQLEQAAAIRRSAVDGIAWLVPPPPLGPWIPSVADWVAANHRDGVVVHGECGDGELALALAAKALTVRGAEPRGAPAWRAAERGVDVHLGPLQELLEGTPPHSLGGLVLSGVVDRLAVEDVVALLALATDRLADGAPLVVLGTTPSAVDARWDAVARDLVPGRPLAPGTWELLLTRSDYEDVGPLPGPAGPPLYALTARRPR